MGKEDDVQEHLKAELIRRAQEGRVSLEEAARDMARFGVPRPSLDLAVAALLDEMRHNVDVGSSIINPDSHKAWYLGPIENGHWSAYKHMWKASGRPGIDDLDRSTTSVTALLADPKSTQRRKGLVMGNVQSGKTGNFAGVIAKAVDAGYRLVIVMGGLHNNLRQQTQRRLVNDVFGPGWNLLTGKVQDLPHIDYPQHEIAPTQPTGAVVKKNVKRLQNLIDVLDGLPRESLEKIPVLIIDDEADQATPNSPTAHVDVSAINELMREVWKRVKVGTYVAYTATPFANVLMDPGDEEELFPSDFIVSLQPGPTYIGAEQVFGAAEVLEDGVQVYSDGLDMVRKVPDSDSSMLRPPSKAADRALFIPPVVPSLEAALRWFFIATTVRKLRGSEEHSSMLIHTTHYADPHTAMQRELQTWLRREISEIPSDVYRELWENERKRVQPNEQRHLPDWGQIVEVLPRVLASVKFVVDNGQSTDRLSYAEEAPQVIVAIGGGTLSRGLTLEGLVVSYFTRTSNTYDTLMQMGRWFGYRDGYEDLPRLWVSQDLDRDYAFLARVERDLRAEIEALANSTYTPSQVGVKVRCHPGRLEITSVSRMRHARIAQLSLSGVPRQTFILDASTSGIAEENLRAVTDLVGKGLHKERYLRSERLMAYGVTSEEVVTFLEAFQSHNDQVVLQSQEQKKAMGDWIRKFAPDADWSVMIPDNSAADARERLGTLTIAEHEVRMVNRAPLRGSTASRLDFKAVASPSDWIADIRHGSSLPELPKTYSDMLRARIQHAQGRGLIVVYPISPRSSPSRTGNSNQLLSRIEIPVNHFVLAYAIVFPNVSDEDGAQGTFVSVRTENIIKSGYEGVEIENTIPEDTEDGE